MAGSKIGRPPWRPTEQERAQVRALVGYGIPIKEIAGLLGVTDKTLFRYCRREIDSGATYANAKAAEFLFHRFSPPAGQEITDERAAVAAAMFWLKTRAGWRERVEIGGIPGQPIEHEHRHHVDKFIAQLDQIADRLGQVAGREAGAGIGRSDKAPDADQETVH